MDGFVTDFRISGTALLAKTAPRDTQPSIRLYIRPRHEINASRKLDAGRDVTRSFIAKYVMWKSRRGPGCGGSAQ